MKKCSLTYGVLNKFSKDCLIFPNSRKLLGFFPQVLLLNTMYFSLIE